MHGGYQGASDEQLLAIPYLRFRQELRLAIEAAERTEHANLEALTFAAWQIRSAVLAPHMKQGKSLPNFGPYLRSLGLARKPAKAPPADDSEQASIRAAQAVRDAFKRGYQKASG